LITLGGKEGYAQPGRQGKGGRGFFAGKGENLGTEQKKNKVAKCPQNMGHSARRKLTRGNTKESCLFKEKSGDKTRSEKKVFPEKDTLFMGELSQTRTTGAFRKRRRGKTSSF